ncbi:hypothetical protein WJX77_004611 [Trebouxia sp. C0004]
MQAYAVKDATDILQQYTRLRSGTEVLDFLMRNIEAAERMKIVETKILAMVVFCAQLNDSAKHYVMRFMAVYLRLDETNNEAESSQADRPEVSAAKQQVAWSYAQYYERRNQPDDPNGSTALEAISQSGSSPAGSQSASHTAAKGDGASDSDGEGKEESDDREQAEGEEDEEEEDEEEEDEEEVL